MAEDQELPPAPAAAPEPSPPSAPVDSKVDEAIGRVLGATDEMKGIAEKKSAETKPLIEKAMAANAKPLPTPPKMQRVGDPPKANNGQAAMEWMQSAALLGAIAGAATRGNTTAALNAFAGAITGFKQGQMDQAEEKYKEWKAQTEKAVKNNEISQHEYRQVLESRKMTVDQQMNQIQLVAAKYQDDMMANAAATKNFTLVAQLYERRDEAGLKLKAKMEAIDAKMQKQLAEITKAGTPEEAQQLVAAINAEQDPAKKQQLMWAYQQRHPSPGALTPEAIEQLAARSNKGDTTVFTNLGRGKQGAENVTAIRNRAAKEGTSPDEQIKKRQQFVGDTAYQRTAGTMAARVENATNEVAALIPQAIETSRALPRGSWVPINTLIQKFQAGTSDPRYYDFSLANFSLMNAYARAMNPQGVPRITERLEAHAAGVLAMATDQKSYEVQVHRLWKEVEASKGAVAATREGRKDLPAGQPMPGPPPAADDGWKVQRVQ